MGKLSDIVFGTPEQRKRKKELKLKEKAAYRKGYEKAKIRRAYKSGFSAGKTTKMERVRGALASVESSIDSLEAGGGVFDLSLGPAPRKRKTKKTKRKATTIRVNGTTITISKKRRKKKR